MRIVSLLMLVGCGEVAEYYPNVYDGLYEDCTSNLERCENEIKERLGDEKGIAVNGMKYLILESDPWLVNMVAYNIREVTTNCPVKNHENSIAYIKLGKLHPDFGRVCVVDQDYLNSSLAWALMLVHEAGHARPNGRVVSHETCDKKAPSFFVGKEACDKNEFSSVGAELIFWESHYGKKTSFHDEVIQVQVEETVSRIYSLR